MAETELLPCVRCGGEMALHENDWADPPMWSAYCLALETCGIHMPERLTRDEAIVVANWRTPPSTAGWLPMASAQPITDRNTRQAVVAEWCLAAFGEGQAASVPQRGIRLLEEAVEAAQAAGCDKDMAHKLIGRTLAGRCFRRRGFAR